MSPRYPARVFLLDDDDGFRSMVCRRLLGLEDGFEVVGGADASNAGIALARVCRPDIVLLGVDGPRGRGLDLPPDLRRVAPAARIAVLSAAHPDLAMLATVLFGGADTCLHKVEAVPQLALVLALLLEDDRAEPPPNHQRLQETDTCSLLTTTGNSDRPTHTRPGPMIDRDRDRRPASSTRDTAAHPVEREAEQQPFQRDPTTEALGRTIRTIRRAKGLPLQRVEELTRGEFKASVLGAYERGERAISLLRLQRLAEFYRVSVGELLPHTDEAANWEYRLGGVKGPASEEQPRRWVPTKQPDPNREQDTATPVRLSEALADTPSRPRQVLMVTQHIEMLETLTTTTTARPDHGPSKPSGARAQPGVTLIAVAGELAEAVRSSSIFRDDQTLNLRALVAIAEAAYAATKGRVAPTRPASPTE